MLFYLISIPVFRINILTPILNGLAPPDYIKIFTPLQAAILEAPIGLLRLFK